jgi:hypothetical protein
MFPDGRLPRPVTGLQLRKRKYDQITRRPGLGCGLDILALNAVSRRDGPIVARHEVPGKASLERTVP